MKNIDITILVIMIIFSFYCVFINLIKRFRYPGNRLFVIVNILSIAMYSIILYQILYDKSGSLTILSKIFFSLLLLIFQIYAAIYHIFPRWEKRSPVYLILITQIPGILMILPSLFTNQVIIGTGYSNALIHTYGKFGIFYVAVYAYYIISVFLILYYRSKSFENASFRKQISPLAAGLFIGLISFTALFFILPIFYNIHEYAIMGIVPLAFSLIFIMNHALSDKKYIDFKNLYLKAAVRLAVIAVLFIPVYLLLEGRIFSKISQNIYLLIIGSIFLSFYLLISYNILRPFGEKIINIKNKTLLGLFNSISNNISRISSIKKQLDWDDFNEGINYLCKSMGITGASLFLLDKESAVFEPVHTYGEKTGISALADSESIVISVKKYKRIIERSLIYTDRELQEYKDVLLKFFNDHNIELALPIFPSQGELLALLFLGKLNDKKIYSKDFISFLDNIGVKLSESLENVLFSEEVRKTQIKKRDRMVVKYIKKRIIPTNFKDIEGLKISSLFINNSDFGGDYFDAVKIHADKIGIYIANTSEIRVESAMLALQMNSVFHSQAETHESPEGLMNIINQVLCSSRFTERYATALYMIYNTSTREIAFSDAAFNPLVIFDPNNETFIESEAEGIPVGIDIGFHYKFKTLLAPPGGIGLCYSHGLPSAFDKEGNNYPIGRIKDIIRINKNESPLSLVRKIYDDFKNFIKGAALLNDVSLIIFRTL